MRDGWYGDKRDLLKWSALLHLAETRGVKEIVQVAYYRPTDWPDIEIDGKTVELRPDVLFHFRNMQGVTQIGGKITVAVWSEPFRDRAAYTRDVVARLANHSVRPVLAFLDPDTGLEPQKAKLEHVRGGELGAIWSALRPGDLLAIYQHRHRSSDWLQRKHEQVANAIGLPAVDVGIARAPGLVDDVALFFATKV